MKGPFKLRPEQIVRLVGPLGHCFCSDRITVDGQKVGYMYREEPDSEGDSGWRFFAGDESEEYCDDSNRFQLYEVNTIANYDPAIIPYLNSESGSQLERAAGTDRFQTVE